jgi:MFS family permease
MSMTTRTSLATPAVLGLCSAFAALEGYDLACYGVTVPSLLVDPGVGATKTSAGTVGSLVAVGMLVGAGLSAALARRLGGKRALLGGAAVFSVGMLACALAHAFWLFGAARLVVGVGLGIVLPTVTAYLARLSAPHRRSRDIGTMMAGYAAGALLAPLLGAALLPGASWRWIYLVGALPSVVLLPVAARLLPDAPRSGAPSSDAPGSGAPSSDTPSSGAPGPVRGGGELLGLRPLLASGARMVTVLFWVVSFCGLLLVFGISTWLPTIMQTAGYSLGSSLLQAATMWVGAGVGMVCGGVVADRVGPKPVVAAAFLAGSVSLLLMSLHPATGPLFLLMFVSGLGFIGSQALTNAFIVTRYPDPLRAPGIGWALSVGRLGAITGPMFGAAILSSGLAVQWNFYLFAVPGLIGAVLVAVMPEVRRTGSSERRPQAGFV